MANSYTSFSPQFLDEIRSRVPASDVIGRYVELKPKPGGEKLGCCPFHNEKTPSFTVSDQKGFYHCFGCGAHGDIIRFLTDHTGAPFPEIVEQLAQEAGLEMPKPDPQAAKREKKRAELTDVTAAATQFFIEQLHNDLGKSAREYIRKRSLTRGAVNHFSIGYAPDSWDALRTHLLEQNITEKQMEEVGLVTHSPEKKKYYDRFRGRLIFPIHNIRGDVIAFGGRVIGEGEPKYLNSPETPLFHKGRVLYNLNRAREEAYQQGQMIIVEGYMDVIALSQAGYRNSVAPLGTAITEDHLQQLWKIVDTPILCLDGDNAGKRAMERAANLAIPMLQPGKSLQFVILPQGQDPDDVLNSGGKAALDDLLANTKPLVDVLWDMTLSQNKLSTPEGKAAFEDALLKHTATIQNTTVQSYYEKEYKNRLWQMSRNPQSKTSFKASGNPTSSKTNTLPLKAPITKDTTLLNYQQLLLILAYHPYLLEHEKTENMLMNFETKDNDTGRLQQFLLDTLENEEEPTHIELTQEIKNIIEKWSKNLYFHSNLHKNDVEKSVINAAWEYFLAQYEYQLLEREYIELSKQGTEESVELLLELQKQREHARSAIKQLKLYFEDLTETI